MKLAGGMHVAVCLIPIVLLLITFPQKVYIYIGDSEAYQPNATTLTQAANLLATMHTLHYEFCNEAQEINRMSGQS